MDTTQREIRHRLQGALAQLQVRLNREHLASEACPDANELASRLNEQDIHLALCQRLTRQMAELRQALERLEVGDFGDCDQCGEEIALERLLARPTARLCVACQTALERGLAYAS